MANLLEILLSVALVIAITVILVTLICVSYKKRQYHLRQKHVSHGPPIPTRPAQLYHAGSEVLIEMPPDPPPKHGYGSITRAPSAGNFTYEELETATGGFATSNLLGEGGFGCVYKGVLPAGLLVAVKRLKLGGGQGEKEFRAEVEIISRVHHGNLVSLVGYCIAGTQRLLVYDYVPNDTLEYHLHRKKEGKVMDWPTRLKIASGAARGLAYLHEDCRPRIIHRDIKSANILLDYSFDAQVSDFGLAKLTWDTHVSTKVMGTFGYLAPEYAASGKLTNKSDVFSFGVVLLELVTGRKPVDAAHSFGEEFDSLVLWARPVLMQINSEEDLDLLVDPSLNGAYDRKEMFRMVEAAAACIRQSASKRPRMGQVVRALEEDGDIGKVVKPGNSSSELGSKYSGGGTASDFGITTSTSSGDYQEVAR